MEFYTLKDIDKMLTINRISSGHLRSVHNRMLRKLLSSYQSFLKYKGVLKRFMKTIIFRPFSKIFTATSLKTFKDKDVKAGALAMENHIRSCKGAALRTFRRASRFSMQ